MSLTCSTVATTLEEVHVMVGTMLCARALVRRLVLMYTTCMPGRPSAAACCRYSVYALLSAASAREHPISSAAMRYTCSTPKFLLLQPGWGGGGFCHCQRPPKRQPQEKAVHKRWGAHRPSAEVLVGWLIISSHDGETGACTIAVLYMEDKRLST